ncbi:hypothetical protein NE237_003258 [Protea cynaroides]|uniref:Uncharacterized protein n=1 Tax=Protea cynaroides TaxID=273540 RepID=A0A9Q0KGP4_9MAGN|nr:hypothetical protein NE237_003258 [Protea cynaroides]
MEMNQNLGFQDEEEEEGNHSQQQLHNSYDLFSLSFPMLPRLSRSILEDASGYLERIHQEMEQIEKELSKRSEDNGRSSSGGSCSGPDPAPKILRMETEKLVEGSFMVKIISMKGPNIVAAQVQRVFESLELDVKTTSISVQENNPYEMLTTSLVEVNKVMPMTEEELHDLNTKWKGKAWVSTLK